MYKYKPVNELETLNEGERNITCPHCGNEKYEELSGKSYALLKCGGCKRFFVLEEVDDQLPVHKKQSGIESLAGVKTIDGVSLVDEENDHVIILDSSLTDNETNVWAIIPVFILGGILAYTYSTLSIGLLIAISVLIALLVFYLFGSSFYNKTHIVFDITSINLLRHPFRNPFSQTNLVNEEITQIYITRTMEELKYEQQSGKNLQMAFDLWAVTNSGLRKHILRNENYNLLLFLEEQMERMLMIVDVPMENEYVPEQGRKR